MVGFSVGVNDITLTDARVRGGGLAPEYQTIEEAAHMWDLGFWDGKPYPAALMSLRCGFLYLLRKDSERFDSV